MAVWLGGSRVADLEQKKVVARAGELAAKKAKPSVDWSEESSAARSEKCMASESAAWTAA